MKFFSLLAITLATLGCQKKSPVDHVVPEPGRYFSMEDAREDLISFSQGIGARGKNLSQDTLTLPADTISPSPALKTIPPKDPRPSSINRPKSSPKKRAVPKTNATVSFPDSLFVRRPFTPEEIGRFIRNRYGRALERLAAKDSTVLVLAEEAQIYSQDGSFFLLKSEWAFQKGNPEQALVQADLALRKRFGLDPDGAKKASLMRCRALEAIKKARPSQLANARAARAWLAYNLMYTP